MFGVELKRKTEEAAGRNRRLSSRASLRRWRGECIGVAARTRCYARCLDRSLICTLILSPIRRFGVMLRRFWWNVFRVASPSLFHWILLYECELVSRFNQ